MSQLYILTDSGDVDCATAAEIEAAGYTSNSEFLRVCGLLEDALLTAQAEVKAIIAFEPVVRELLMLAKGLIPDSDYTRLELSVDTMYADTSEAS